jgi:hypothetical protein
MSELETLTGRVFSVTKTGITWLEQPTLDQYLEIGSFLSYGMEGFKWAVGDLMAYGEREFGEDAYQAQVNLRMSPGHLRNLAWVARKIPPARRNAELTWSQHAEIAGKVEDPEAQKRWTEKAEGLTVAELRAQLEQEFGVKKPKRMSVREAARLVVDSAFTGDTDAWGPVWLVPQDAFQALCESIGENRTVVEQ